MSVFKRIKDILSVNTNAVLERMENPQKMLEQYLRNTEKDLYRVKSETAAVMAEEKRIKQQIDNYDKSILEFSHYAKIALANGNEDDATEFLLKKQEAESSKENLQAAYEVAMENTWKMKELHDNLEKTYQELRQKVDMLQCRATVANARLRVNSSVAYNASSANDNILAFRKMEERINRMVVQAETLEELSESQKQGEDLIKKYQKEEELLSVQKELEELKNTITA